MGDQPPSLVGTRFKLPCAKHNVASHRVGIRVYVPRRLLSSSTGMHPHSGKIVTEALLHVLP